jgi:hypothetical protein
MCFYVSNCDQPPSLSKPNMILYARAYSTLIEDCAMLTENCATHSRLKCERGEDAMPCTRCGGLVIENWWECVANVRQRKLQGTKCVNCGAIDDPVIVANRLRPRPARAIISRGIAAGMGHVPVPLVATWPNSIRTPRMQSRRSRPHAKQGPAEVGSWPVSQDK